MLQIFSRLLAFVLVFSAALPAMGARYLAMEPMDGRSVRVDGMLREWPGQFFQFKSAQGHQSNHSALIGYDDEFVYLAAKIADKTIARSKNGSAKEDHLSVSIYFPQPGQPGRTSEIDVFPGDAQKKISALVKVNGKTISGASAVEAPNSSGFSLEAKIPWTAVGGRKPLLLGMRGKLRYFDATRVGHVQSVTEHGTGSGRAMPPLTTAAETGLIQTLLEPKGLKLSPDREAYGDLTGTGGPEKIALYGHFLSILGPGYKAGKQYYFSELDVERAEQVTRLSLLDLNGDGKQEILLQKRLGKKDDYREVLQALQVSADGTPQVIFAHEVSLVTPEGRVENKVAISGQGTAARITIAQGATQGFKPGTFAEPSIGGGIESALLPWDEVGSRTYGWKGQGLALLDVASWRPKLRPAQASTGVVTVAPPPPPRPPSSDELQSRVYGLYKSDRKVPKNSKASFDFVTDVVGDGEMERVVVHDRDLLVFGKGFKQGLSYTYLTIGVKEAGDILSVTTHDLVGDGKAEIIVHAVLQAQASESMGGDIVARQALFIYKVQGETLTRIFAAETGRSLRENRILSCIAFLPDGDKFDLELRPLRALGWSKGSYPFPEDQHPAGGLEPLLLPWSSLGARRYSFDGEAYTKK